MTSKLQSIRAVNGDAQALKAILEALAKHEGNKQKTATELGVSDTTLYRIIGELDAWPRIETFCMEKGITLRGGRRSRKDLPPQAR